MAVNTMHTHTTRRQALLWLASSAPLLSAGPAVWAASATAPATPDPRLVVVMLRGALDGLAADQVADGGKGGGAHGRVFR